MQFSSLWPTYYFVEFYMFKSLNLFPILNIQPCFMEVTKDIFLCKNFLQGNLPTTYYKVVVQTYLVEFFTRQFAK